ncbi:outer membrane beta-barrel protein [Jiulongibacter sp. NS-SX5]|uniref:outer membrane beta-barrel protein n=1 Tax=Jiulongibacter sp. NS-SX5 TaxID=3463854 RepID=UPI004058C62E
MKKLFKTLSIAILAITSINTIQAQDYDHHRDWDSEWDDNDQHRKSHRRENMFDKKDFGLVLALNNFDAAVDMPELSTWQSRYVALQWRRNNKLITGRHVDVALGTGLEFAWNNLMMRYDEQYFEAGNISDFELVDETLIKSKLVNNFVNIPVMLQFGFKESNFRLGIGAYGGVRINSYQKFEDAYGKFKEKGEYNLRRFNYGLMAEAGRGDVRLFAKYDMQPLFNDNNPINANVFSIGLRL